jgi:hypothetical protein
LYILDESGGLAVKPIQFESDVKSGVIRIPEQYVGIIPRVVRVTLAPAHETRIISATKSGAGALTSGDFSALKIDTRDWTFDRGDVNERR